MLKSVVAESSTQLSRFVKELSITKELIVSIVSHNNQLILFYYE